MISVDSINSQSKLLETPAFTHQALNANRESDSIKVSLEFFPAATHTAQQSQWDAIEELKLLHPNMVSVTYGANGSQTDNTHRLVERIKTQTNLQVAPHLTCYGGTKTEILYIAQEYWALGIRQLVVLRGDPPNDPSHVAPPSSRFTYCSELVEALMLQHDFDITVAAFPETHPEAASPKDDLENLKRKFDAGAKQAITQFFFSNAHYLRFRDHCSLFGIENKIIPGILPVNNFQQVKRFAKQNGTQIPRWLKQSFLGLDDQPKTRKLLAAAIAIEQVAHLHHHGVNDFHLYTLNQADIAGAICHSLGLRQETLEAIKP